MWLLLVFFLPVLVKLCILHPLLRVALIWFHYVLDLLNIDAVTLEDVMQDFYQVIQSFWLHHLGLLHLSNDDVLEDMFGFFFLFLFFFFFFFPWYLSPAKTTGFLLPTLCRRLLFIGQRCNLGASWWRTVPFWEEVNAHSSESNWNQLCYEPMMKYCQGDVAALSPHFIHGDYTRFVFDFAPFNQKLFTHVAH